MSEREVQFKVFRYKQGQSTPRYETFTVKVDENTTVLVALQDIRRDQDPTLILRHSCHHASCGTCGMRINGQEQLACVVKVVELGTPEVVVEPLQNLPVLSDLVVDMSGFYERYTTPDMAYVRQSEFLAGAKAPEGIKAYERYENCLECGCCVSACPIAGSDDGYLGPAALAAAWRVVEEPRTGDPKYALAWADQPKGCWRCHVAFECSEVCPSQVYPGEAIMSLRKELTRRKFRRFFGRGG
ncbi:MAG: succinate dehydrogenase/fumarate reductase iron-sulfur subunit [Candidatus Promineifilaceae bacterium]|nr:succinate dehydrogenase/fumarate reductase iron-sulfur subunit [Candidatus Promineifilaceae bacterium]